MSSRIIAMFLTIFSLIDTTTLRLYIFDCPPLELEFLLQIRG